MTCKNINLNNQGLICFKDEDERLAFEKFKIAVADLEQEDSVLIRFLRARDRNLANAGKMLRASLAWRKEINVSSYVNWNPPNFLKDEYGFQFKHTGEDHEGRPVIWLPVGGLHGKECIDDGRKEDIYKWSYHLMESTFVKLKESSGNQCVVIIEAENLELKRAFHLEAMQLMYKVFQNLEQNYPEILRFGVIINAPWYLSTFFNFLKPILSAHTLSKIHLFNNNKDKWMELLLEIMPRASIPEIYLDN